MKAKLIRIFFGLVVTIVSSIAMLGAGAASHINAYQPEVPEKLR